MLWPEEWIAAGIALATTTIAAIGALLLASYDVQGSYLVFLIAVVLALIWGGRSAGLSAAVFSCLLTWFFFVPPLWSFGLPTVADAFTAALLFAVAVLITLTWERQQRMIDDLTDAMADLRAKLKRAGRADRL